MFVYIRSSAFVFVVTQKLVLQQSKNVTAKCTETKSPPPSTQFSLVYPNPIPLTFCVFFPYIMRPSPPYYILRFFLTFAPFPYPLHFAIFPFLYNERPSTPSYIVRPSPFFPFLLHCASFHSPTTIYHGHIAIWKRMFPTFLKPSLDIKDIIS